MAERFLNPLANMKNLSLFVAGLWLGSTATVALGADSPFVERGAELGLDFRYFNGMSGELYFAEHMGGGVAFLDYDGDGDLDVFVTQGVMLGSGKELSEALVPAAYPAPLTDRLYRNDLRVGDDGSLRPAFVDVTDRSRIESTGYGVGVVSGDVDNDGWPDLYVNNLGANALLRNRGDGTFEEVAREAGVGELKWSVSSAFADLDNDGWLDLYVGNYVNYRVPTDKPCASVTGARDYCGPLSYQPEADRLYRNLGDGSFEDVSSRAGIGGQAGSTLGVISADFDADGLLDVYVANDQLPNYLWQNQGDFSFEDTALLAGAAVNAVGQPEASMGVVAGDIDANGTEDLFMAHLARETNTLYLNQGDAFFEDATKGAGLDMGSYPFTGFGTALLDFDSDGWLDLFVANGEVKRIGEQLAAGEVLPLRQRNQLFRNHGSGSFEEVPPVEGGFLSTSQVSRGTASGDLDNDGDPDLLVINNAGSSALGMNEGSPAGGWLGADLRTRERAALGTNVAVRFADGTSRWRRVRTDGSYASSNDARVLFGLGQRARVDAVRVNWLGGGSVEWRDLPAGRYVVGWERPSGAEPRP